MLGRAKLVLLVMMVGCFSLSRAQSKGGRWQFEGNGDDTAAWDNAANAGILQGQAAYAGTWPAPEGFTYLWLDSAFKHDFVKIEDHPDLDFENENIGISMWIYPVILNDVHFLLNKGTQTDAAKSTGYALRLSLAKKVEFLIRDSNNKAQTAESGITVPLNQWTFIAAFYNYATGKVYFWNQATEMPVDSVNFKFNYYQNDGPLSIGSWYRNDLQAPSIKDFQGGIDDVRISGRLEDLFPENTGVRSASTTPVTTTDFHVYPNPVRASSAGNVSFYLNKADAGPGVLSIYNLCGQLVFRAYLHQLQIEWKLRDFHGARLPAGHYGVQWQTGNESYRQNLIIIK